MKEATREAVQKAIHNSPQVLINVVSGRLPRRSEQADGFKSLLAFHKLVSSMTTQLDWVWSNTCCISQEDLTVLQEALTAVFKWYEGEALTVIYLRASANISWT